MLRYVTLIIFITFRVSFYDSDDNFPVTKKKLNYRASFNFYNTDENELNYNITYIIMHTRIEGWAKSQKTKPCGRSSKLHTHFVCGLKL